MRNAESPQRHLDDAERTEDHRRIDMTHVRDAEGFAVQPPEPPSKGDTAFEIAVIMQKTRVISVSQKHGCHRVGTLARFYDVDLDCFALLPNRNRAAHRLGKQLVTQEYIVEPFLKQHVERLAQSK